MIERRSKNLGNRLYRFTTKRIVGYVAVLMMVLGWSLVLVAGNSAPYDDTSLHIAFAATLFGGALAFMGVFAGISRWVAEPAARKVLAEHIDKGMQAHPDLVPRVEWDSHHRELMKEVKEIRIMVAELAGRAGGMTRQKKEA